MLQTRSLSLQINTTPNTIALNEVSWQSAVWPVITCMLLVMMQNTGRVVSVCPEYSTALRASPLVCALDTLMTLVEFSCLLIAGCPISNAARHVWYNRFAKSSQKVPRDRTEEERNPMIGLAEDHQSNTNDEERSHGIETIPIHLQDLTAEGASIARSIPLIPETPRIFREVDSSNRLESTIATRSPGQVEPLAHVRSPATLIAREQNLQEGTSNTGIASSALWAWKYVEFYPGSGIDRTWRVSMGAFAVGALPQIVKIFAMRGIPWTQACVSVYTIAFMIPEIFRLMAGMAGEVELHPAPLSSRIEYVLFATRMISVVCAICVSSCVYWWYIYQALVLAASGILLPPLIISLSIVLGFSITKTVLWGLSFLLSSYTFTFHQGPSGLSAAFSDPILKLFSASLKIVKEIFALDASDLVIVQNFNITLFVVTSSAFSIITYRLLLSLFIETWIKVFFRISFVTFFICSSILTFTVLLLAYRALFVGAYSHIPRRLTGVNGSTAEFACGCFVLLVVCGTFSGYAVPTWDASGTYKPGWAENLG